MTDEKPTAGKSYTMGDVGAHARVAQGENIQWTEGARAAGGDDLVQQFQELLARIAEAPDLDDDTRDLARAKVEAVAEGLGTAAEEPGALRRALVDAKAFLSTAAGWVGSTLGRILSSEAAQKTLGTVTDATVRAAVASLSGMP